MRQNFLKLIAVTGLTFALFSAHAGAVKKVAKVTRAATATAGAAVVVGGAALLYKWSKDNDVGSLAHNLANRSDPEVWLRANPSFIPELEQQLGEIMNTPNLPPEKYGPYVTLIQRLNEYGVVQVSCGLYCTEAPPIPGVSTASSQEQPPTPGVSATSPRDLPPNLPPKYVRYQGSAEEENVNLLEQVLLAHGFGPKPEGYVAFHIAKHKSDGVREIFKTSNVNINCSCNGMFLPQAQAQALNESESYARYVSDVIKNDYQIQRDIRSTMAVIQAIRQDLLQGIQRWE